MVVQTKEICLGIKSNGKEQNPRFEIKNKSSSLGIFKSHFNHKQND